MADRRRRRGKAAEADKQTDIEDAIQEQDSEETRVTRPDKEADKQPAIETELVEPEPQEPEAAPEVKRADLRPPYTPIGSEVFDRDKRRVALAGFDHNRKQSGPGLAKAVADGLNALAGPRYKT